jgi:hypothetical protein
LGIFTFFGVARGPSLVQVGDYCFKGELVVAGTLLCLYLSPVFTQGFVPDDRSNRIGWRCAAAFVVVLYVCNCSSGSVEGIAQCIGSIRVSFGRFGYYASHMRVLLTLLLKMIFSSEVALICERVWVEVPGADMYLPHICTYLSQSHAEPQTSQPRHWHFHPHPHQPALTHHQITTTHPTMK